MKRINRGSSDLVKYFLLLIILKFISFFPLNAQQESDVVILEHADSLRGLVIDGEEARSLIGNVRIRHGKTEIKCTNAIQYFTSKKVQMEGVVEVKDDTMRLVGMRGMYYTEPRIAEIYDRVLLEEPGTVLQAGYGKYFMNEKKAYFKVNVNVEDSTSVLASDELTYFREEEKSIADGNVKIINPKNGITIYGNHFENYKKLKYNMVTDHPKLVQIDTDPKGKRDTLIVTALKFESYQDTLERLIATDSVKIIRNDLAGESGICTYYADLDSIVLQQSPYVWYVSSKYDDNQVSGETIYIKLKKRRIEKVYVREKAVAISRADSQYVNRFNQLTGQEIILCFQNDKIQQIDVNNTATSLYYLFDMAKGNGLNKSTADQIKIRFIDGKIDKINAISNVEGQYYPEKMVKGKEGDFNLPEFNWRENRSLLR